MAVPGKKGCTVSVPRQYILSDGDQLRDGLSHLLEEKTLCDVELEADGKLFPIHRVVLAAASSYFEAMFTRGFTEAQVGIIKLEDISSKGLQMVLHAIYKGKVELCEDNIYDALSAGHHLQYQPLLRVCENYITDTVSPSNCINYRFLAHAHDMTSVVDNIDQYILDNFKDFSLSEGFLELSKEELGGYLREDALIADEIEVFEAIKRWLTHNKVTTESMDEIASLFRYGLIGNDRIKEVLETLPSLKMEVQSTTLCDGTDDVHKFSVNPILQKNELAYQVRGYKTYAMLLRGRSDPYRYANTGERDKLAFLREKQVNGKTEFVGWHAIPPAAFLDSSVHSFVYSNSWFLLGVDSDGYSYCFVRFDSRTKTWVTHDPPTTFAAVGTYGFLLNDRICIGGGAHVSMDMDSKEEMPYVTDGACIYDISTSKWHQIAVEKPRIAFAASCVYNGEGFIIGGYRSREDREDSDDDDFLPFDEYALVKSVYVYKPDLGEYVTKAPLNSPRYQASAGVAGDYILVVGGLSGDSRRPEKACEVYSPQCNQWTYARGDSSISDALVVPTICGFAVLKGESYPLEYFEVDSEGKVSTYKKLAEPAVKWMPGKDHWAYIEGNVMTLAVLTLLPNAKTGWEYKVKETTLTLVKRK